VFGRSHGSRQTVEMSRASVRKRLAPVLGRTRKLAVSNASRSSPGEAGLRNVGSPQGGSSDTRTELECRGAALSGLRVIRPEPNFPAAV
jgi:hypothetical protein